MQSTIGRTPSGHTTAIRASKVQGTSVYNKAGESIGHVEDVVLDKMSDRILFAIVGFGGFLGIGEKYHPLPWSQLDYDENQGGYVVNLTREQLEAAPSYDMHELTKPDGEAHEKSRSYYSSLSTMPPGAGI
jgi:sporulation protein YlmC with PRC-barrel domain